MYCESFNVAIKPTTMYHIPYPSHLDRLAMRHVNENEMPMFKATFFHY